MQVKSCLLHARLRVLDKKRLAPSNKIARYQNHVSHGGLSQKYKMMAMLRLLARSLKTTPTNYCNRTCECYFVCLCVARSLLAQICQVTCERYCELLLSVLSAMPGNITTSLPGIVYKCIARVNNTIRNERVILHSKQTIRIFNVYRPVILLANDSSYRVCSNKQCMFL